MADCLDIVLFGASGFTGKYCIGKLHRLTKAKGRSLTWGIAGRSEKKLKDILSEYAKTDENVSSIPIIVADVQDYSSLVRMTSRAKVLINCCGPYRFFGEPVVKACLETGTHQVDVTGEPQYMESIQLKYHETAKEKGVYIVSACGFDSIPADLGVIFLQKNFEGTLNSVETYLHSAEDLPQSPGPSANYATWESAVYGLAHASELSTLRRKLYPTRLPNFLPKQKSRSPIHKSKLVNKWCVPFLGSDRSVVLRSQRYLYEEKKLRPAQAQCYMELDSVLYVMLMVIFGKLFQYLVKYEFGRKLLLQYPSFFSFGIFDHNGPSDRKLSRTKFSMKIYGEGWSEQLSEADDQYNKPPNKNVVAEVSGVNPAYGVTCSAVSLSAIVILTETGSLPNKGGVYPPGAAFENTTLIDQLQENGLNFKIISEGC